MARFYGTVRGGRGEATRLGHATSGLRVSAQSYSGDISVELFAKGDEDWVVIRAGDHYGRGSGQCIYHGPIEPLTKQSALKSLITGLSCEMLKDQAA
jgi:hypothetical protein